MIVQLNLFLEILAVPFIGGAYTWLLGQRIAQRSRTVNMPRPDFSPRGLGTVSSVRWTDGVVLYRAEALPKNSASAAPISFGLSS